MMTNVVPFKTLSKEVVFIDVPNQLDLETNNSDLAKADRDIEIAAIALIVAVKRLLNIVPEAGMRLEELEMLYKQMVENRNNPLEGLKTRMKLLIIGLHVQTMIAQSLVGLAARSSVADDAMSSVE